MNTTRLEQLESIARSLEPLADERAGLRAAAAGYTERFLGEVAGLPGYVPDDARAIAASPDPVVVDEPEPIESILTTLWESVDRLGVNEMAGHFFGFIPGPNLYASAIADYLAAVTNRYTGIAYGAPGVIRLQQELLEWLAGHVGYPAGSGADLTSGGSIGNLVAIVTARDASGLGPGDFPRMVVYLTEQTHHSVHKALRIAGLGTAVLRHIPLDRHHRMDAEHLADQVAADRRIGLYPWLVVAAGGTTDTGAIDPLALIADVCAAESMWFHVDAAYGGGFSLCETGRARLAGIERSDSMVMDPHKALFVPFGTGVVLVKDRDAMLRSHAYDASYLQDTGADLPSPADLSPELTRPNRVLRVWLPLRLHGAVAFRAALEEKLLLAELLHHRLGAIPAIERGPAPDLSVVTFRCRGRNGDNEAATRRLHRALLDDGRIFLSSTNLRGEYTLRMAVLNVRTHREHIERAVEAISELAPAAT